MTDPTHPSAPALRAAEVRLIERLYRESPAWFSTARAGIDRESRQPVIRAYAVPGGLDAARAWVAGQGGRWEGFAMVAADEPGR